MLRISQSEISPSWRPWARLTTLLVVLLVVPAGLLAGPAGPGDPGQEVFTHAPSRETVAARQALSSPALVVHNGSGVRQRLLEPASYPVRGSQLPDFDSIPDVGFGLDKSYLDTEMTLYDFRKYLWCPQLMEREWNGSETDEVVLRRLQDRVDELIASYEKPAVDPNKLAKMRAVTERARKDLLT